MEIPITYYENEQGACVAILGANTVNKIAYELAVMYKEAYGNDIPLSWEEIADCLIGYPKRTYDEYTIWKLIKLLENECFHKYDWIILSVMVDTLFNLKVVPDPSSFYEAG